MHAGATGAGGGGKSLPYPLAFPQFLTSCVDYGGGWITRAITEARRTPVSAGSCGGWATLHRDASKKRQKGWGVMHQSNDRPEPGLEFVVRV